MDVYAFSGDIPEGFENIPGALPMQFVGPGCPADEIQHDEGPGWVNWIAGPLMDVFIATRESDTEYCPFYFLGLSDGVMLVPLGDVRKESWMEVGQELTKKFDLKPESRIRWLILASDAKVVESDDLEGPQEWLQKHGTLAGHPDAEECLNLHVESRELDGIKRRVMQFRYEVNNKTLHWIGKPRIVNPKNSLGLMTEEILS